MPTGPTIEVAMHQPMVRAALNPGEGRRSVSSTRLILIDGSNTPATVQLTGKAKGADLLVGADQATLTLRPGPGVAPVVEASTSEGSLSINAGNGQLVWTPTAPQAAALSPGKYVAQAWVRFGSASSWEPSEAFWVEVRTAVGGPA